MIVHGMLSFVQAVVCVLTGDFYVFFLHHYDEFSFGGEFFEFFFVVKIVLINSRLNSV